MAIFAGFMVVYCVLDLLMVAFSWLSRLRDASRVLLRPKTRTGMGQASLHFLAGSGKSEALAGCFQETSTDKKSINL